MVGKPNKTTFTSQSVFDFLAGVESEQKRLDSLVLIDMMREISGEEPAMWGPSIIGFGKHHYKYDSGREGNTPALAFSPRKANLTIYFDGFERHGDLLAKLGKHTISVACLYIKKLADVDIAVLRELIERLYKDLKSDRPKATSVDEYEAAVPEPAQKAFRELRALLKSALPHAEEVISYAIPAYKVDARRPVVYISGWKDHVAVYPVPHTKSLQKDMKPYIKGKGTLWFGLDVPLPTKLIKAVVEAHVSERK